MEAAVGKEDFYSVLREYVHRNAFKNADPESFFEILYECTGDDNEKLNAIIAAAFDLPETNSFVKIQLENSI